MSTTNDKSQGASKFDGVVSKPRGLLTPAERKLLATARAVTDAELALKNQKAAVQSASERIAPLEKAVQDAKTQLQAQMAALEAK